LSVAEPRPPLAPTATLVAAARAHAGDMRDRGYFAHVSPEGVGPNERLRAAGVPLTMGVKVEGRTARYSTSPGANQVEAIQRSRQASAGRVPPGALASSSRAVDLLIIDRCVVDRGHRRHLLGVPALNAGDREVGVGVAVKEGPIPERPGWFEWLSYLDIVTVNPAHEQRYVTGVVYEDRDKDGRYSLGEGLAGQRVTLTELALATETGPGGGYSLAVPAGSAGVVQALGQAKPFTLEASNVKVDFVR
ncbi:MAG: hypothetical protein H6740_28245, partial [Alphaproteobacteria bacterium]|nr:hypothetical protein [Alphaproteobacteria bacterium]